MSNHIKVEGHENLYRDPQTGAIINKNIPVKKSFSKQFSTVIDDINNLKNEISVIKNLLEELIKNGNY